MSQKNDEISPVGAELIGALSEFRDALKDRVPLNEQFTVRTMKLDLRPSEHGPEDVQRIRKQILKVSQRIFANFIGVNVGTVRAWEQGTRKPTPMACRFMDEIVFSPAHWQERLLNASSSCEQGSNMD